MILTSWSALITYHRRFNDRVTWWLNRGTWSHGHYCLNYHVHVTAPVHRGFVLPFTVRSVSLTKSYRYRWDWRVRYFYVGYVVGDRRTIFYAIIEIISSFILFIFRHENRHTIDVTVTTLTLNLPAQNDVDTTNFVVYDYTIFYFYLISKMHFYCEARQVNRLGV